MNTGTEEDPLALFAQLYTGESRETSPEAIAYTQQLDSDSMNPDMFSEGAVYNFEGNSFRTLGEGSMTDGNPIISSTTNGSSRHIMMYDFGNPGLNSRVSSHQVSPTMQSSILEVQGASHAECKEMKRTLKTGMLPLPFITAKDFLSCMF